MQTKKQSFVEIDGKKMVYEVAGEGTPLLLAHAGFLDSGMWDEQWEVFSKHYRVIRYDMRGYGKSDPLAGPVSRRAELYALLKHLEIEQVYLVGCSLGGGAVLDFALEHPEMVLGLVMVSTVPGGFEFQGEPPAELLEMVGAMQKQDLARVAELQMRLWIDGPFRQPHEVSPAVRQRAAAMNQMPVQNATWVLEMEPVNPLSPPAAQRLQHLHVPTLVVAGALDNPEILRAAEMMATEIKGAQIAVLQGAAHTPNMEKPAEFNRIVMDFMQGVNLS